MKVIETTSKHVSTREDWNPTVDGKVKVTISEYEDNSCLVSVWGGDDTGMERVFIFRLTGRRMYDQITDNVTRKWLRKRGFRSA